MAVWFDPASPGYQQDADRLRGKFLLDEYRCQQCHEFSHLPHDPKLRRRLLLGATNLKALRGRITADYLQAKILDPSALRNDSRMPALLSNDTVGGEILPRLAAYLLAAPSTEPEPSN